MKALVLLVLVLSLMLVGCAQETPDAPVDTGDNDITGEVTSDEVIAEVDDSLIAEDEEVEIGDMI